MNVVLKVVVLLMASVTQARDEEQPRYQVLLTEGDFQIRNYATYYVAETSFDKSKGESTGDAFRKLFGYISGDNKTSKKIEMTAPVEVGERSQKIEMTAPVTIASSSSVKTMTFMVPSRFYPDDIPEPTNPQVKIRKVASQLRAVIQFSWFAGEEKQAEKSSELFKWIKQLKDYKVTGKPFYAGYNPPYSLPWLKTHEMMVKIVKLD